MWIFWKLFSYFPQLFQFSLKFSGFSQKISDFFKMFSLCLKNFWFFPKFLKLYNRIFWFLRFSPKFSIKPFSIFLRFILFSEKFSDFHKNFSIFFKNFSIFLGFFQKNQIFKQIFWLFTETFLFSQDFVCSQKISDFHETFPNFPIIFRVQTKFFHFSLNFLQFYTKIAFFYEFCACACVCAKHWAFPTLVKLHYKFLPTNSNWFDLSFWRKKKKFNKTFSI